ncbi:EAL domain-containing protein [Rheinheimera sp.]|uniref:EAL domain-containing protein n=1 Tax=Rheinheimera sp. TaxID=1869214 RepID=UPI003AF6CE6C
MLRIRSVPFVLFSLLVYMAAVSIYCYQHYQHNYQSRLAQVDQKLLDAAQAVPYLLGENYHSGIQGAQHISRSRYLELAKNLSDYAKKLQIQYLYSMVLVDGKVHFTSSSYTEDDLLKGQLSYFYDYYPEATEANKAAFASTSPVFEQSQDQFGEFRSVLVPMTSPDGTVYLVGADMALADVKLWLVQSLIEAISSSAVFFALALLLALCYAALLRYNLTTDPQSGCRNGLALEEHLRKRRFPQCQLAIVQVNNLEEISHLYGTSLAEQAMQNFIHRLSGQTGDAFSIYRLAFEKLAIRRVRAVPDQSLHDLLTQVDFNEAVLEDPYLIFTVTLGIAQGDALSVLENATLAVNTARLQQQPLLVYSDSLLALKQHLHTNIKMAREVREAIGHEQVVPYFQPVVHISTGEVYQYECLARILRSDGSILTPDQFLSIINRSYMDAELTKMMFIKSASQFAQAKVSWSMNITSRDLLDDDLQQFFLDYLAHYPEPQRVCFELAEAGVQPQLDRCKAAIKALQQAGAKVVLDDFGSASGIGLADLLQLQVDGLKLDGSLTELISHDQDVQLFIEHISSFARQTHLLLIAEMVESKQALDMLERSGIRYAQGYYFGPAAPVPLRSHEKGL